MGTAFTGIVNSFVTDIVSPVLGVYVSHSSIFSIIYLILFFLSMTQKNLENVFVVLHCASNASMACIPWAGTGRPYSTVLQANTDGAVTVNISNSSIIMF
jgi:hypothetical protein